MVVMLIPLKLQRRQDAVKQNSFWKWKKSGTKIMNLFPDSEEDDVMKSQKNLDIITSAKPVSAAAPIMPTIQHQTLRTPSCLFRRD